MKSSISNNNLRFSTSRSGGIQHELTRRVHQGLWTKGSMIPSRRALAQEFQVSVPTVQKVISDMIADGILRVDANRTFVLDAPDYSPVETGASADLSTASSVRPAIGKVALLAAIRPGVTGNVGNLWPVVIADEAEHTLAQAGAQLVFFNRYNTEIRLHNASTLLTESQKRLVDEAVVAEVIREHPDVVIAIIDGLAYDMHRHVRTFRQAGVQVVSVNAEPAFGMGCMTVSYDNTDAGYQATDHLIQRGCRRLLFFAPYRSNFGDQRLDGFWHACSGRDLDRSLQQYHVGSDEITQIREIDETVKHFDLAYDHAKAYLLSAPNFDGVVAANDRIAAGFARAAIECGRGAGRDYLLIGFDDEGQSRNMGLSSMHPPMASMGRESALAVTKLLNGQNDLSAIVLKSRLVARASSALDPSGEHAGIGERFIWHEE